MSNILLIAKVSNKCPETLTERKEAILLIFFSYPVSPP